MNERKLLVRFGADMSEFEKALLKANKSAREFGKEVGDLGKTLSSAITVPLVAVGAASVAASETIDDAMDRIRIGTGQTGDDLGKLGDSFRAVFNEVPESAEQVSTAIAELSKRTGASGTELESLATQMLELGRVSGTEVGPLIESTEKAFASWSVATKDQSQELDFLWKVSQSTGVGVSDLAGTMSSSGATLRALGLDFETSAAMIGQFQKAGIDSSTMMAGLTKGASEYAKEGKSMADGLKETVAQIKATNDPTAAAAIAIDKFGKSGVAMADAIKKGSLDVDRFLTTLRASPETINRAAQDTAGLAEAFGTLRNKVTTALEPLGVAITKVLVDLANIAGKLTDNVLAPLMRAFGSLPEPVQSAVVVMGGVAAAIGPVLIGIGGLITTFASMSTGILAMKATIGPAIAGVAALFPAAGATIAGAWAGLTGAFAGTAGIVGSITSAIGGIGATLASFATGPVVIGVAAIALIALKWDWIKEKLIAGAELVKTGFSVTWSAIRESTSAAWSSISTTVSGAVTSVLAQTVSMGTSMLAAAKASLVPFTEALMSGMRSAGEAASQLWTSMKAAAGEAGASITSQMQGVLSSMGSIVGQIVDAASRAAASVASSVSNMASSISSALSNASAAEAKLRDMGRLTDGSNFHGLGDGNTNTGGPLSGSVTGSLAGGVDNGTSRLIEGGRSGGTKDIIFDGSGGTRISGGLPSSSDYGAKDIYWDSNTSFGDVVRRGTGSTPAPVTPPSGYSPPSGSYTPPAMGVGANNSPYLTPPVNKIGVGGMWDNILNPSAETSGSNRRSMPYLADGGVVTGPTPAMIGEAGPEAVIPLAKLPGMMGSMGGGAGRGDVHVHVHVNGSVQTQQDLAEELRKRLIRTQQRNNTSGVV